MRLSIELENGDTYPNVFVPVAAVADMHAALDAEIVGSGDSSAALAQATFCAWWVATHNGWSDAPDWNAFGEVAMVRVLPKAEASDPL